MEAKATLGVAEALEAGEYADVDVPHSHRADLTAASLYDVPSLLGSIR